jgi:hypothetical protein
MQCNMPMSRTLNTFIFAWFSVSLHPLNFCDSGMILIIKLILGDIVSYLSCIWNENTVRNLLPLSSLYKKFWEELAACFPWYDMDGIENDSSNNSSTVVCVFIAVVMFSPSRCLATIGRYTYTQPDGRDLRSTPLSCAHVPWYTYCNVYS